MSSERRTYDPVLAQLGYLTGFDRERLQLEDLCNPTAVLLLIQQRKIALMEVQSLKQRTDELESNNSLLTSECGDLRVELAKSQERDLVSWIEIPVGALAGYALSLFPNSQNMGLILLILSMALLFFLRWSYISPIIERIRRKV